MHFKITTEFIIDSTLFCPVREVKEKKIVTESCFKCKKNHDLNGRNSVQLKFFSGKYLQIEFCFGPYIAKTRKPITDIFHLTLFSRALTLQRLLHEK